MLKRKKPAQNHSALRHRQPKINVKHLKRAAKQSKQHAFCGRNVRQKNKERGVRIPLFFGFCKAKIDNFVKNLTLQNATSNEYEICERIIIYSVNGLRG
jgi:hypothetical protein